ncbi:hypothetical protein H312_03353 [Anncaliia algerae PRA339]|uniref:Uncharacterized protein n=1 Tax=Anncaliia algerae PRA339 TaxID=1288291 RepID=A0A059EWY2_9MICR|nr:hypothetical protein H312_03353 [Anncaliia algerae PRA339]
MYGIIILLYFIKISIYVHNTLNADNFDSCFSSICKESLIVNNFLKGSQNLNLLNFKMKKDCFMLPVIDINLFTLEEKKMLILKAFSYSNASTKKKEKLTKILSYNPETLEKQI